MSSICHLKLSQECTEPEVLLDCPPHFSAAPCCIPCGKAFQIKFPLAAQAISLRPIETAVAIPESELMKAMEDLNAEARRPRKARAAAAVD